MDKAYMLRALELAGRGCGKVSPNPLVGAVIVKNGRVIGEGYHAQYGGPHAERNALLDCASRGESPSGAEMYVTLEPCCHQGKQPPCTDALIKAGISRVYVGSGDPNPKVAGRGVQILRAHGVEVVENILRPECDELNAIFFHYIRTGLPFVILKYAMSLDGKTACYNGASRWITGEEARRHVHETRNRCAAVMVGVRTVILDDPMLNCRLPGGRDPLRIVCDSRLRTPLDSRLVKSAGSIPSVIACSCADRDKKESYEAAGCQVWQCGTPGAPVDLHALMRRLGERQIDSVLLEGGSTLAWSALRARLVQRVQAYVSPKLLGGQGAPTPLGGQGVSDPSEAFHLHSVRCRRLGSDFLMEGDVC